MRETHGHDEQLSLTGDELLAMDPRDYAEVPAGAVDLNGIEPTQFEQIRDRLIETARNDNDAALPTEFELNKMPLRRRLKITTEVLEDRLGKGLAQEIAFRGFYD